jgi:hypothetical protein
MHNNDIKPYLARKRLVLCKPDALELFRALEGYRQDEVTELTEPLTRKIGLTRVRVAVNNMIRDNKDWIFV